MASTDVLIDLEIKKSQDPTSGKYNMIVKVVRYQNIQCQIFVYQHDPVTNEDYFSNVASPAQLTSLPKHHSQPGNVYFLEHTVELEFDTAKEMNDTENMMLIDIEQLKKDWDLIRDQLDVTYNVVIQ